MDPSFTTTTEPMDQLLGDGPFRTQEVTLTDLSSFGPLQRGTVLGRVTANGKYGVSLVGAVDGSEVGSAILVKDADPSSGDLDGVPVYVGGGFNENAITYGDGPVFALVKREELRAWGIYTSPVPAGYSAA